SSGALLCLRGGGIAQVASGLDLVPADTWPGPDVWREPREGVGEAQDGTTEGCPRTGLGGWRADGWVEGRSRSRSLVALLCARAARAPPLSSGIYLAALLGAAEIGVAQGRVGAQVARASLHDLAAEFQDVGAVGELQRLVGILLDQQDRKSARAVELPDQREHL